ncbi:hypothetical protein GCM10009608_46580 [Pseudonocardia alaniniphila]
MRSGWGSIYNRERPIGSTVGYRWHVLIDRRDGNPAPGARRTRMQPVDPDGIQVDDMSNGPRTA